MGVKGSCDGVDVMGSVSSRRYSSAPLAGVLVHESGPVAWGARGVGGAGREVICD